jgi:Protein of unknown function (DUF2935).
MATVTYKNTDTNRFWLNLFADNALLVYNALSPVEQEYTSQAKSFADKFDALALRANQNPTAAQTAQINREARQVLQDFRTYLLRLLDAVLVSNYWIALKPAVLNYFVDEAERYLTLINSFEQNRTPAYSPLFEEIYWLRNFSIQNRYIADNIGYFLVRNRETAQNFADILTNSEAYSYVLYGLSRIGTEDFPMAREHHIEVFELLEGYYDFLSNLIVLQQQRKLPSSISLLYLDRARRILCYYLKNMALYLDTKAPDCDPYAKRISSY